MSKLLLAIALVVLGSQVQADIYTSAGGGANFWAKTSNDDELEAGSEAGYLAYIATGLVMDKGYRAELELSYRRNNVHGINDPKNDFKSTGDGNIIVGVGGFVNLAYDFAVSSYFKPYVMGGTGLLYLSVDDDGGAENPLDDSSMTYGLQLGAGARFNIQDNLRGAIGVRHMFTSSTNLDGLKTEYDTSAITVTLIKDF